MHLAPLGAHHHCILVIDDDQDTPYAMQALLGLYGHDQVSVATNGADAFTKLRENFHPCIILLDMHMPTMDGLHFLEAKAADPALAPIPVIAVSGSGEENPVLTGVAAFMLKPIDIEQLLATMVEHCANDDTRRIPAEHIYPPATASGKVAP